MNISLIKKYNSAHLTSCIGTMLNQVLEPEGS